MDHQNCHSLSIHTIAFLTTGNDSGPGLFNRQITKQFMVKVGYDKRQNIHKYWLHNVMN